MRPVVVLLLMVSFTVKALVSTRTLSTRRFGLRKLRADWSEWEASIRKVAGTPRSIDLLREAVKFEKTSTPMPDSVYAAVFPFALDDFQLAALRSLRRDRNVIVSAPTGSGKTVAGEVAIAYALARDLRVFYTTPLKALSNQKFDDFRKRFGAENVGLSTGDSGINRDANIVVMTTEVFRNILYNDPAFFVSGDEEKRWGDLYACVFDEFHYMNDAQRGTVWEESLISCPRSARVVALSATVSNAKELRGWLQRIHGDTDTVESQFRPVPLRYEYCQDDVLLPLFRSPDVGPGSVGEARDRARMQTPTSGGTRRRARTRWELNPDLLDDAGLLQDDRGRGNNRRRGSSSKRTMPTPDLVRRLNERKLLPAIFFLFSRNGCATAAAALVASLGDESSSRKRRQRDKVGGFQDPGARRRKNRGDSLKWLLNRDETAEVKRRVTEWRKVNEVEIDKAFAQRLEKGVASHHAGLLPQHKTLVEELFKVGLVKVCFATETLAAGVNLPARTVVVTALSKRGDRGPVRLTASALLQMAGRAGRRGIDDLGTVVIARSRFASEDPRLARKILLSSVEPVKSRFRSTYGMATALLRRHADMVVCKALVENSFGAYLLSRQQETKDILQTAQADEEEIGVPAAAAAVVAVKRTPEEVEKDWEAKFGDDITMADARQYAKLALRALDLEQAQAALRRTENLNDDDAVDRAVQKAKRDLAKTNVGRLPKSRRSECMHLLNEWRASRRERRKKGRRAPSSSSSSEGGDDVSPQWESFIAVLGVLRAFGAVDDESNLTALGNLVASLKSENELLVALAVISEPFARVATEGSPAEFAALVSTLVCDIAESKQVTVDLDLDDLLDEPDDYGVPRLVNDYGVPQLVADAVGDLLDDVATPLAEAQFHRGLHDDLLPVRIDDRCAGVVESFAAGAQWYEVSGSVNLDDGDLVRLFRRTLELLRSIAALPSYAPIPNALRIKARQAARDLDRPPVLDYIPPQHTPLAEEDDDLDDIIFDNDDEDIDDDDDDPGDAAAGDVVVVEGDDDLPRTWSRDDDDVLFTPSDEVRSLLSDLVAADDLKK